MINIKEASDLLGVSKKTLRRWEKLGKLKTYRTPGNHRRYIKEDLLKIMDIKL